MVTRYQADTRHPADSFAFAQDRLWALAGPRLCKAQVDIHIEVPRVEAGLDRPAARARQAARFEGTRMLANSTPLAPVVRGRLPSVATAAPRFELASSISRSLACQGSPAHRHCALGMVLSGRRKHSRSSCY